jgi:hypothetical protein
MIKLFRRVRYDLMEKNKTAKYLKYAVGEIVLVVIGILIALSINNWNENAKNKRIEISYLIRIFKDLENDLLEFEKTKEIAQQRNDRVIFLQHAIEDVDLVYKSSDYFVNSIVIAGYTYRPSISNHSFDELKSSGRLALIQNEELRVSIAKYYDFVFNQSQWNFLAEEVQLKYNEYSTGILNQDQLNKVLSESDTLNITKKQLEDIFQRFLSKKEFHSLLPQVFQYKYEAILSMDNSKEYAERLKLDIQNELNSI